MSNDTDDHKGTYQLRSLPAGTTRVGRPGTKITRASEEAKLGGAPVASLVACAVQALIARPREPICELGYHTHARIHRQISRANVLEHIAQAAQEATNG